MGSNQTEISLAQRKRAVTQAFAGKKMPAEIGEALGVTASAIYIWCADSRFGGKEGGLSGRNSSAHKKYGEPWKSVQSKSNGPLPTKAAAKRPGPRALVPTAFACPHCGLPIRKE